jgi:hypothetical protein
MDLQDLWWEGVDWIHLSQDRKMVMNLQLPQNAGNFLTSRGTFSISSKILLHWDLITHEITHSTILIHPSFCKVKSLFSDANKRVYSLRISLAQPQQAWQHVLNHSSNNVTCTRVKVLTEMFMQMHWLTNGYWHFKAPHCFWNVSKYLQVNMWQLRRPEF